jgi:peptide methionine sulfoxide reductase MsrA
VSNENLISIVKEYLTNNKFDGLFTDDCDCCINELFEYCGQSVIHCKPGYKNGRTIRSTPEIIPKNSDEFNKVIQEKFKQIKTDLKNNTLRSVLEYIDSMQKWNDYLNEKLKETEK